MDNSDRSESALATTLPPPWFRGVWPGLTLTGSIALAALAIHRLPGAEAFSPMFLSILIGVAVQNLIGVSSAARAGVVFAMRRLLRAGIVLLGLQVSLAQVGSLGAGGISVIVSALAATFLFAKWMGRIIGVEPGLAELIAAGTAVCGASAIVATNTVTRASDEDVAYAVACVTVFGSLSVLLYPLLCAPLALSPREYGLWTGASIHEVAQVVAAAFQGGAAVGSLATVAKLTRVIFLAPLVLALGAWARRRGGGTAGEGATDGPPTPWFVFGFIALVVLNSAVRLPSVTSQIIEPLTAFLLSTALAAMGVETDLRKLRARGRRPLLLAAIAWAFIAATSLAMIRIVDYLSQ